MSTIRRVKNVARSLAALSFGLAVALPVVANAATSPLTLQASAVATSLNTATASAGVQDSLNTLASETWDSTSISKACAKMVVACAYGTGSKSVVLYGDSHAPMWAAAVVPALLAKGFRVMMYWMPGCTPGHVAVATPMCTDAWRKSVEDAVTKAKVKPKAVILAERSTDLTLAAGGAVSGATLTAGLVNAIKVLKSKGTKVIVLGDNPVMMFGSTYNPSYSPAGCVSAHLNDLRTCDTSLSSSLSHTLSGAEKAAAKTTGATFIDTSPWVCSTTRQLCPVVINNRVAYRDAFHFSWTYVASLKDLVSAALASPLGYK